MPHVFSTAFEPAHEILILAAFPSNGGSDNPYFSHAQSMVKMKTQNKIWNSSSAVYIKRRYKRPLSICFMYQILMY